MKSDQVGWIARFALAQDHKLLVHTSLESEQGKKKEKCRWFFARKDLTSSSTLRALDTVNHLLFNARANVVERLS